ncbi:pyridoxal-dependent decarboxylase, exosortase A system-associated [Thiohalocapsa sp. ML1]|uniref:pyridoxal-dependent decarboxylase, exosortase A system-associated n=1 Tax=Thiohalocapsa sp. ML1 TaxID=1431688 RepID=UPI0007320E5E|nr:pyridoxal-dependent decarboxylase, exosortase A system-associated [Thiohalocapsa sp. ML1]
MKAKLAHASLVQFPVVEDELVIGGVPIGQLAGRVGRTPFYAYDRSAISSRIADLRATLPAGISLHYAIKANPMPAVVGHVAQLVDGLDVASVGEMHVALDTGTCSSAISFAGPGKSSAELSAAVKAGICLNIESSGELERVVQTGETLGLGPRVAVRVNPDFELKSSGMKMSGGPKPFGIDAEQVPAILQRIGETGLDFQGFHIFSGSQNLKAGSLIEAHDKTFELAYRLADHAPSPVNTLNIGGGFGIPYFPGEQRLDLAPICNNLAEHRDACRERLGNVELVLELGRYLVAEAGVYVCEVVDKKISRGTTYLVTNGGLHHHLAASGNFGQVIRKDYPVVTAHRVHGGPRELVSVVGPLCTPLDILADSMELGQADVGDLIAVLQSGAYGFTASPHLFLGHPAPVEVLV